MSDHPRTAVPPPSPEQRRIAADSYQRASQVAATGNFDYAIKLLTNCCRLDPANLSFRKALRQAQKAKFKNNLRGSRLAALTTAPLKARLKAAHASGHLLRVLELGEGILSANPWDLGAQMAMGEAADDLGMLDMAIWLLDQARQKDAQNAHLNRTLARLLERRGLFTQAIKLWELVRRADPSDQEAASKAKDLAASETIARGQYEAASQSDRETDLDAPASPAAAPAQGPTAKSAAPSPQAPTGPVLRPDVGGDRADREAEPYRARVAASPTEPGPYLELANHYRRAGLADAARSVLAEGLGPTGQHQLLTVALLEMDLEPFRGNLALTEERLASGPTDELRKIRARLLKEINAREMELYRLKADRDPGDPAHRLELGLRLLRSGQVEAAIPELQRARKDPRFQWRALLYLGHCFRQKGHWKLAERNFAEALPLVPPTEEGHRKEILYQLATGTAEAGDLTKAVELGMELADLDYGYRDVGKLLDDWQARLQKA